MKRILTGLQPSGELTLGSLIGSISQMVKYQDEYESFMFVPDMHAITVKQDPKLLKERIIKNVALYIACGLDPKKNTIYIQSENLYHTNLIMGIRMPYLYRRSISYDPVQRQIKKTRKRNSRFIYISHSNGFRYLII